ncbi:MAG TPA: helicase-related protein, partial [Candidatus Limnocylindrales bacterium]
QRPVQSAVIYGGVGFDNQVRQIRQGPEIVVATPGRLLDHVGQRTIDLSRVEVLVLDEADRMLDMGFIHDIKKVIALLPVARQNLLFSATFSAEIRRLAAEFLKDPAYVQVTPKNTAPELVKQLVIPVDKSRKRELLAQLVKSGRIYQALVFTRTKHGADRLVQQLSLDGISAVAIHGNKSQPQRVRALNDFKRNKVAILVATDIAARGLDIDALPHVVNYELPMVASDYVHRIGRTGRAGTDGDAISLVCVDENAMLREIETLLGHKIEQEIIPGFTPDRSIRPQAIQTRSPRPFQPRHQPEARQRGFGRPGQAAGRPAYGQRRPANGSSRPSYGQSRPAHGGHRPPQASIGRPMALPGERLSRG